MSKEVESDSLARAKLRELRKLVGQGLLPQAVLTQASSETPLLPAPQPEIPQALESPAKPDTSITLNQQTISERIIGIVPDMHLKVWLGLEHLDLQVYSQEVKDLARYVLEFASGKVDLVHPLSLPGQTKAEKIESSVGFIRQTIASFILDSQSLQRPGAKWSWARKFNELRDFLGSGSREILRLALDNLSNPERAIVLSVTSVNLAEQLGYVDLDECDEVRLAAYIRNTAFNPNIAERDSDFGLLVNTVIERNDSGDLDAARVLEEVYKPPYKDLIIERIIESSKYGCYQDLLVLLFTLHPQTHHFAVQIDEASEEGEPIPWRRILNKEEYRGRKFVPFRRQ